VKKLFLILFLSASVISFAQPYLFKKDYNVKSLAAFRHKSNIIKLPNNGYAVCFEDTSGLHTSNGINHLSLITFLPNGDTDWALEIPIEGTGYSPSHIFLDEDGNILLSFSMYTNKSDTIDYNWYVSAIVCKIDLSGNLIWSKRFGSASEQNYIRNIFGRNNQIYLCGDSYDTSSSVVKTFLTRINSDGDIILSKRYYLPNLITSFITTDNGDINNNGDIILTINSGISTDNYHYFLCLDTLGNINWAKRMQTSGFYGSEIHSIVTTNDGAFILAGREDFVSNGDWDIFFLKISSQGNLIFSKAMGGIWPDEAMHIEVNHNNEILLFCEPESYANGVSQTAVYKLDSLGNMIWGNLYNSGQASYPSSAVKNIEDSTYTIFGINGSYLDWENIFLLKIDDDGNAPCNSQPVTFPILDFGQLEPISVTDSVGPIKLDTIFGSNNVSITSTLICDLGTYFIPNIPISEPCKLTYFIPNVFSPNMDGYNNLFTIEVQCYKFFHIDIYNRWGQQLFQSDLPNLSWDGRTTSGVRVPEGTYYYIVKIDSIIEKGFLTLLR
jgi:gliding motility-associated-like protein